LIHFKCFQVVGLAVEASAAGPNFQIEQKSAKVTKGNVLRRNKSLITRSSGTSLSVSLDSGGDGFGQIFAGAGRHDAGCFSRIG